MARNPLIRKKEKSYTTPMKNQSAGILDDFAVRKVISTKEGTVTKVAVNDNDIVNKAYFDANAASLPVPVADVSYDANYTVEDVFDNSLNEGIFIAPVLSDGGGLDVSWGTGTVYDHNTKTLINTTAGSDTCVDNAVNFLIWPGSGTTLTLGTTRADITADEIDIGHFHCSAGDIIDGIHQESVMCQRQTNIGDALANMFPIVVTEGIICSEHAGDNTWDIDSSAGVYYHDGHERHDISAIDSTVTAMTRHFHTAGALDNDSNAQIDSTMYNNGTDLAAVTANKYYRSLFIVDPSNVIHWIYPDTLYDTASQAIEGLDPAVPGGLEGFPKSIALVLRGDDAALPAAASDQWVDVREIIGTTSAGIISDHTNLTSIGVNTHAQIDTAVTAVGVNSTHVAGDGSDHADVASNTAASHAESHTVVSHSDTTATGAELDTLTGGGDTTLHDHDGISENTAARHTQNTDTALGSGAVAADHGTAATDQIINVSYGTGAAPTANTTTIGSLYVKYTA